MSKNFIIVCFLLLCVTFVYSQPRAIFDATFDACDAFDQADAKMGTIAGNPSCECGVNDMGFRFDGMNDSIGFDENIDRILNQDFALSFYFFLENAPGNDSEVDLISFGNEECVRDSSLTVRYVPVINSIRVEVSINQSIIFNMVGEIPPGPCWNYIVINKNDDRLQMFINNQLVDENENFDRTFRFKPGGIFSIGASPCISSFSTRLRGLIDEVRIYDQVLEENEVLIENLQPDQIITEDQTIFIGESLALQTGNSCSNSFSWNPTTALSDPNSASPTVSPLETTVYNYIVNYGTCSSFDSIRVSVVDPSVSQCDELLVPNAFTPNQDRRNDQFGISNDFIIDDLISFQVFSKWGEKLFESTSVSEKWDGTFQGDELNPGTFLYRAVYTCSGEEFSASGSFVLIR